MKVENVFFLLLKQGFETQFIICDICICSHVILKFHRTISFQSCETRLLKNLKPQKKSQNAQSKIVPRKHGTSTWYMLGNLHSSSLAEPMIRLPRISIGLSLSHNAMLASLQCTSSGHARRFGGCYSLLIFGMIFRGVAIVVFERFSGPAFRWLQWKCCHLRFLFRK